MAALGHQASRYDAVLGVSYWTKNYRTGLDAADPLALERERPYHDPIHTLPARGQAWWRSQGSGEQPARLARAP